MNLKPQRLAKWIATNGYCSRRNAERLISASKVNVNGQIAKHTDLVTANDTIIIDQQPLIINPERVYYKYHKPVGIDCNIKADDSASLYHVLQLIPQRVFAVGRLDKDSSGLLLLTNDGLLCQRLIHPDFHHKKSYRVKVDRDIDANFISQLSQGVSWQLGSKIYTSRPCQLEPINKREFIITLTQGLHRQIRYMCKSQGVNVLNLCRISLHNIQLANLAVTAIEPIQDEALTSLLQLVQTENIHCTAD
ncbi:pseudouridine synthase [Rheinheimera sp. MMS21-TC3]|uniref:pseudouridine synthase n=1 Tax=Rheinheimera sp. MMS21-TC3 TaxID=3072790 RepID=UPI0028C42596|nr:pseudouridine synthase [Rheinheimera sp. MMS21-TC3]WNO60755.1 pseudouridine synthase [Rheinheimera sp. MMS21-TC3]